MIVRAYGKLSRHSLKIDILFPRSCLFFGTRTILRRYLMICAIWYVTSHNTVPRTCAHEETQAGDYEAKGITGSHGIFSVSSKTKDLDEKFGQVLTLMELDTAGGLVEVLSRQGKLSSRFGQSAATIDNVIIRVFTTDHRSMEGLCVGLGGEVFHGD